MRERERERERDVCMCVGRESYVPSASREISPPPLTLLLQLTIPPPPSNSEGSELTSQQFRWDQRLFTVLLRLPGIGEERNSTPNISEASGNGYLLGDTAIASMCEQTGGE